MLNSLRRTVVPMVMGWVLSLPIAPYVDETALETAIVAIVGAVYYAVMRLLEERGIKLATFAIGLGPVGAPEYPEA